MTAWLALIGLLAHLLVAGAVQAVASNAQTPFPICHAHGSDDATHDDHPAPDRHDHCALCSLHCHAAATLPPVAAMLHRDVVLATGTTRTPSRAPAPCRHRVGTSPRGPPQAG